jgi:integrase
MSQRLSDVIHEYGTYQAAQGASKNTAKTHKYAFDKLLLHCGNIQVRHVTDRHIDELFAAQQAKGLSPNSMSVLRTAYRGLFEYAIRRRYVPDRRNPVAHIRAFKVMPARKLRIPANRFDSLLDAASHPRDRILVALGLYLFLRASEVKALRVGDINLDDAEAHVTIQKTKQRDDMPICTELDRELRRWLTFYTQDQQAPLDPDWWLVPAHASPRPEWSPDAKRWTMRYGERNLNPERVFGNPARRVCATLDKAGYATRKDDGKPAYEGVHTLRRSGARALFDQRVDEGYDGAIREVQAMLHHSTTAMTEHYLGLELDVQRRNHSIKGKPMFTPAIGAYVVRLREAEGR